MIGNGQAFNVSQELKDATSKYLASRGHGTSQDCETSWGVMRYEFLKAQVKFEGEALITEITPNTRMHRGANFWYDLTMRIPAAHPGETIDDAIDLWLETLLDVKRPGK
ncbi:hypothetical protein Voja6_00230 [Pseudomonas phage vB_PpuM-Voja-6]